MPTYVNLGLLFIDIVIIYNLVPSIKGKEYLIWQEQSIITVVILTAINVVDFCLIALAIQFMIEKLIPQIDSQAHLGGIIIGAIFNWEAKFTNSKKLLTLIYK